MKRSNSALPSGQEDPETLKPAEVEVFSLSEVVVVIPDIF
jgi:hypothetical protein